MDLIRACSHKLSLLPTVTWFLVRYIRYIFLLEVKCSWWVLLQHTLVGVVAPRPSIITCSLNTRYCLITCGQLNESAKFRFCVRESLFQHLLWSFQPSSAAGGQWRASLSHLSPQESAHCGAAPPLNLPWLHPVLPPSLPPVLFSLFSISSFSLLQAKVKLILFFLIISCR